MPTLNEAIAAEFRAFAKEFIENRVADIRNAKLQNTGALRSSPSTKVSADAASGRFEMLVSAAEYGRYQDMRRRYNKAGGTDMIKSLEAWVEREGIQKFIKGRYAARLRDLPAQDVKNAVAWGIVKKLARGKPTKKRRWWNKGKTHDINKFYDTLLRLVQDAAVNELKTA